MKKPQTSMHNLRTVFTTGTAILTLALALGGCAAQRSVTKAEPTSFLHSTGTAQSGQLARLPFERSWKSPSLNAAHYSHIVIRPVSTAHLRTSQWSQSASTFITSEETFATEASKIARYWDHSLSKAFNSHANRLTRTSDASQPGTLVVEIAMTEIVFGHPVATAASYAVSGGGVANSAIFSPSVGFEASITDGATGQLLATASDRRSTKIKLIDFNKFTFTKSNKEICDEWSQQIMQAFNKELFPTVKRTWVSAF